MEGDSYLIQIPEEFPIKKLYRSISVQLISNVYIFLRSICSGILLFRDQ